MRCDWSTDRKAEDRCRYFRSSAFLTCSSGCTSSNIDISSASSERRRGTKCCVFSSCVVMTCRGRRFQYRLPGERPLLSAVSMTTSKPPILFCRRLDATSNFDVSTYCFVESMISCTCIKTDSKSSSLLQDHSRDKFPLSSLKHSRFFIF